MFDDAKGTQTGLPLLLRKKDERRNSSCVKGKKPLLGGKAAPITVVS
jgi:hypothetical protein